ncbi:esterase/lipase/thioesterase family protein [Raphanus sativus]|nr:esterase/lipase/thioesterase family protein [Raphanus sativus]
MARLAFASASASSPPLTSSARTLRRHFSIFAAAAADPKPPETPRLHHHASLEVIGDRFLPALKDSLSEPYGAFPLVGFNRHVETIYAAFYRSVPLVRLRRECLRTKDNGSVALDWVAGDDTSLPPESPILILLPGLTGGSQDSYVRHMLLRARSKKWRCVVFNSRGCGDSPVTTPQFYSASFLGDISEVVAHVGARFPRANLYAAGWSLGGNILVNYLGQESHNCTLSAAVSLCNPFDLVIADEDFHKGFNNVYDKALSRSLRRIFSKHSLLFEDIGGGFNIPMAANAETVRDFDEGLNPSSSKAIKHVRIPLLCIQAANDPIAPDRGIPRDDIKANPNCMLIVTPRGGHLGWVAGEGAPNGAPWTDPVVMEFLQHVESCQTINGERLLEDVHQIQV